MNRGLPGTLLDVAPEYFPYRDDGCEVSPSCLRCPLPQCKYDDPGWLQRARRKKRDKEIMAALRGDGLSVQQVAARFDLSQRTVFRILRRVGDEYAETSTIGSTGKSRQMKSFIMIRDT